MEAEFFVRSKGLNNIPLKKLNEIIKNIDASNDDLKTKYLKKVAINRYADSNIPIEYWSIRLDKNFSGDSTLINLYNDYVANLKENYMSGKSFCLAGNHGTLKTTTITSLLKKAVEKDYLVLYTTLTDMINALMQPYEDRYLVRNELLKVDFLAIDEFDPRFIGSENASDLFARNIENIFRTRSQNKLPTFMCTNSPNVIESFNGSLKASLDSLFKGYMNIIPIFGEDFRKKNK